MFPHFQSSVAIFLFCGICKLQKVGDIFAHQDGLIFEDSQELNLRGIGGIFVNLIGSCPPPLGALLAQRAEERAPAVSYSETMLPSFRSYPDRLRRGH